MNRKLAIKTLTASDLTLFEWQFRNRNAGNQKAINLNADVFTGTLFPSLPEIADARQGRLPIDLFIYGPGVAGEYNLQRKIVKHGTYKNWRLDGEFIFNPVDNNERFNSLQPNDFVIFEFIGDVFPTAAKALFLSREIVEDRNLHAYCAARVATSRMVAIRESELHDMISNATPVDAHPIYELMLSADLEDAVFNGEEGVSRLLSRPSGRRMSHIDLEQARERAGDTGMRGEDLVNVEFEKQVANGLLKGFEWVSSYNAISPFDFVITENSEEQVLLDVKTTKGEFSRRIHISVNELKAMATDSRRYDLYRVYELDDNCANLRISRDLRTFAISVLESLSDLTPGVSIDSISVPTDLLNFESAIELTIPDDLDEITG